MNCLHTEMYHRDSDFIQNLFVWCFLFFLFIQLRAFKVTTDYTDKHLYRCTVQKKKKEPRAEQEVVRRRCAMHDACQVQTEASRCWSVWLQPHLHDMYMYYTHCFACEALSRRNFKFLIRQRHQIRKQRIPGFSFCQPPQLACTVRTEIKHGSKWLLLGVGKLVNFSIVLTFKG